ncbi:ImmA/IrrE family metallo-endopeptidase [Rheinheimera sp. EpRS3]|uniref:ImmA/IrrE family metallo-endopeptidase n=1 Tax=Rheinheimera sp. EpRS3 TaxID=1712383 RepID=UPI000746704C|nr:ImmA/IrrE family metallo-endopeptidase [Rheinheimera sp. EpRS3]KUM52213.1 peptidase [Rheinheimera sp. EpRS3]
MKNLILSNKTAQDISRRVDRVLKDLGNPEPPIRLEDVRELLKLDLRYYTADDPSLVDEVVSKIKVATIQIYRRPTLLLEAIKKLSLKALYIPDRKRILLDSTLPKLKHRWNQAHEIGHSLIPWHESIMHGDNEQTLSHHCHELVEAEANFAAGRMIFLGDRFEEEALSMRANFDSLTQLKKTYGNTYSTTLYRFVESFGESTPVIGMISCHPHISRRPVDFNPRSPSKHYIQSSAFKHKFGHITDVNVFGALEEFCMNRSGGIIGTSDLVLTDRNGEDHRFMFETFYNSYDALTLGVYLNKESIVVAVP